MVITYRFGHNPSCPGAVSDLLDETNENRIYGKRVIELLEREGVKCIDCTPYPYRPYEDLSVDEDLNQGVQKVNEVESDLFVSFHLNKAYDSYNGAIGSEVYVVKNCCTEGHNIGNRILSNLEDIGFKNRGVQEANFYDLRATNPLAILIEGFFIEATEDVLLYKNNFEKFCCAIASGILNKFIRTDSPKDDFNFELKIGDNSPYIEQIKNIMSRLGYTNFSVHDYFESEKTSNFVYDVCDLQNRLGIESNGVLTRQLLDGAICLLYEQDQARKEEVTPVEEKPVIKEPIKEEPVKEECIFTGIEMILLKDKLILLKKVIEEIEYIVKEGELDQ